MAEEPVAPQNVTKTPEPAPAANVTPTATTPVTTGGKTFTEAELEQIIKDRLDRAQKKSEAEKEKARQDAEAEAAKKNGEWQKLAEQRERELQERDRKLAEAEARDKARELSDLKRSVAEKVGLPAKLAARLVGDDEAALEADATALLETLPKPQPPPEKVKQPPGIVPANPGSNGGVGETVEQRRQRIHGAPGDPWDPAAARNHGGGAFYRDSKE